MSTRCPNERGSDRRGACLTFTFQFSQTESLSRPIIRIYEPSMVSVQHESTGRHGIRPPLAGSSSTGGACSPLASPVWRTPAAPGPTSHFPHGPSPSWRRQTRAAERTRSPGSCRARLRSDKLSPRPMDVINRGGAAGAIGLADLVSRHYGDPHIIMASGSSVISSTVTQNTALRLTDAEPLARLIIDHLIVATPSVVAVCEHPGVARDVPEGSGRRHLVRRFRRRRRPYAGRLDRRGVRHPDGQRALHRVRGRGRGICRPSRRTSHGGRDRIQRVAWSRSGRPPANSRRGITRAIWRSADPDPQGGRTGRAVPSMARRLRYRRG